MNEPDGLSREVAAAVHRAMYASLRVGASVLPLPAADGLVVYWFKSGSIVYDITYTYN